MVLQIGSEKPLFNQLRIFSLDEATLERKPLTGKHGLDSLANRFVRTARVEEPARSSAGTRADPLLAASLSPPRLPDVDDVRGTLDPREGFRSPDHVYAMSAWDGLALERGEVACRVRPASPAKLLGLAFELILDHGDTPVRPTRYRLQERPPRRRDRSEE